MEAGKISAFLNPANWIIPIAITAAFISLLWHFKERIPMRLASAFGPIGGGISTIFTLGLFGTIATGQAIIPAYILFVALVAQFASFVVDFQIKAGWYPKLAGTIVLIWQFFMFFTVAGIAVTGFTTPPELGTLLPFGRAFALEKLILPVLLTAVVVMGLKLSGKLSSGVLTTYAVTSMVMWPAYWMLSNYGLTTGTVFVPLLLAIIPAIGMMVRAVYDFSYEYQKEHAWQVPVLTTVILAETLFFAFYSAGVYL